MKPNQEQTGGYSKRSANNSDIIYGKLPPQAREIEEALLGAILLEKDKLQDVMEIISEPECFYVDAHQRIYGTILKMSSSGKSIDLLTLTDELQKAGDLELVGGHFYVTKLTMGVVTSAHAIPHARIVMEKYMLREVIRNCGEALNNAFDGKADVFDIIEKLEKDLYSLSSQNSGNDLGHIVQDVIEVMNDIEYKRTNKIEFTGIPTGFPDLDRLTGGWQSSDLIILAARPSVGKTAFALNLAFNAAVSPIVKTAVAVFSLEMGRGQIAKRYMSLTTQTRLDSIRNPTKLFTSDITQLNSGNDRYASAPIYVDDTPAITVSQLRGKCRRLQKKWNKQVKDGKMLVIIDYLQLMSSGKFYKGNREQEISSISRDLKEMAKELNVPIIALSQLSREVEKRADKKPNLADLRESGAIEQDADLVALMYRPTPDDIQKIPELANANYLDIAKHRNGELDALPIYKDLSIQKFSDKVLVNPLFVEETYIPQAGIKGRDFSIPQNEQNDSDLPF